MNDKGTNILLIAGIVGVGFLAYNAYQQQQRLLQQQYQYMQSGAGIGQGVFGSILSNPALFSMFGNLFGGKGGVIQSGPNAGRSWTTGSGGYDSGGYGIPGGSYGYIVE